MRIRLYHLVREAIESGIDAGLNASELELTPSAQTHATSKCMEYVLENLNEIIEWGDDPEITLKPS
jgi:hypothetical protein